LCQVKTVTTNLKMAVLVGIRRLCEIYKFSEACPRLQLNVGLRTYIHVRPQMLKSLVDASADGSASTHLWLRLPHVMQFVDTAYVYKFYLLAYVLGTS